MSEEKQATWGGRFSEGPAERMVRFSESVSFDARLAPFDIQGSQAHAKMLAHVGLITEEEKTQILKGLDQILTQINSGDFEWDIRLEDVHMNIEQALTKIVPAASKLHTARSRNDQVATDMRLFFKDACDKLDFCLIKLIQTMLEKAESTINVVIPGYTHLQRAQPVSMAHHLLAYVEMFGRDRLRVQKLKESANFCPLGSGAIAGTTLPIDREFTARELGFINEEGEPQVSQNSMDAVSDRDLFIEFTQICSTLGVHLSRISEDMILWSSSEFGFVRLPDAYTTGSSLMPQKKNPDSLELIRGKVARLFGNATTLLSLVKNLPLTYNRDLQEDKPPVFDSLDTSMDLIMVLEGTISGMQANPEKCKQAVADPLLLATDLVDYLVKKGCPFRDAHHVVGELVGLSESKSVPLNKLDDKAVKAVSKYLKDDWREVFDVTVALESRKGTGMPSPQQVKSQINSWKEKLNNR